MADQHYDSKRLEKVPPLNLLDALYAQGIPKEYLQQLVGMSPQEITDFLLRNFGDRSQIDRAVDMASGKEIEQLKNAKTDYDKLRIAFDSRGVDLSGYKGPKDAEALASYAGTVTGQQVIKNAVATVLPGFKLIGGQTVTDEDRSNVLLFSQPTPPGESPAAPTTRGVPSAGGQGLGGQRVPPAPAATTPSGGPNLTGQVPGTGAPGGTPGAGPGAPTTPAVKKSTPEQIRADLNTKYGWAAALADIPEIQKILTDAAQGLISPEEANNRWLASDFYKETTTNERNWRILAKSDPTEAAFQLQGQTDSIIAKAQAQGIPLDPARAKEIATTSKTYGWSDQQVNAALASEIHWDPNGAKTGTMATIKASVQNQLVPMSDTAMTQWAQAIVSGDKTQADFDAYLKDQAKSLFPSMATYLDTTPGGTVKTYLDPYAQTIGKTLGMNPGDINWSDPKWYRFANQLDPKTGERGVMELADVQRTLIADPQYNYDSTANGKQQKAGLAKTILKDWGFMAGNGGGDFQ